MDRINKKNTEERGTREHREKLDRTNEPQRAKSLKDREAWNAVWQAKLAESGVSEALLPHNSTEATLLHNSTEAADIVEKAATSGNLVARLAVGTYYIGMCSRPVAQEAWKWANRKKPKSRLLSSVLMKGDTPPAIPWKKGRARVPGAGLSDGELQGLGFEYQTLYTTSLIGNALVVEAMLHERYQHLPLGSAHLWRRAIPSPRGLEILGRHAADLGAHVVYFTYSTVVGCELAAGHLVVNGK